MSSCWERIELFSIKKLSVGSISGIFETDKFNAALFGVSLTEGKEEKTVEASEVRNFVPDIRVEIRMII